MAPHAVTPERIQELAAARVVEVACELQTRLDEMTGGLQTLLSEQITELRGDTSLREMLAASTVSNLETFTDIVRYGISLDGLTAPAAAEEYARRLARRGITATALIRAYRLAQQHVLHWLLDGIAQREPDSRVAFAAGQRCMDLAFGYVDAVSERVVAAYEAERERWLANRSTERAAVLASLLRGETVETAVAEAALGHRLAQHHLGAVVWAADGDGTENSLHRCEALLGAVATLAGAQRAPLFVAQDRFIGWGWIPLGSRPAALDLTRVEELVRQAGPGLRLSLGRPAVGGPGFRLTHTEALRAQSVAMIAADRALPLTSFSDCGARTAAMLAADLDATRRLVTGALGPLGDDSDASARLRDTLRVFLEENGSYVATAKRVHLHKNTVKYRVDRAVALRGMPLDAERLELELALIACRWLGGAVLRSAAQPE
ncbi:PucR family transcriptional regulator [Streptomyces sp. NPDC012421]|uniref:PucR family transcriptional regulator n=1 Tax=Streptomyces sp. NPDC012421 TaxID=3364832 RepID=UPI0036EBC344